MISRNGICYDLTMTPYSCKVGNLSYKFSSRIHLEKFKSKLQENRDIINYSLSKRFKLNVDVSVLADVVLYKKIETRGFLIVTNNGVELCQENITLNGQEVTMLD